MDQFTSGESFHIGEVQFFFRSKHTGAERTYTIVSMWSEPDPQLLKESSQAVYASIYHGQETLQVIEAKSMVAVVAMVPMRPADGDRDRKSVV